MIRKKFYIIFLVILLCACSVGPNYKRPNINIPSQYKEAAKETSTKWKVAAPQDQVSRGTWWQIFTDSKLNALETELNNNNQNIALAKSNYAAAKASISAARANYYPTINSAVTLTRQKQSETNGSPNFSTTSSLNLDASWELSLWGSVGRAVEENAALAQASAAFLAAIRLSAEAALAQYYFELRTLDNDQIFLDNIVNKYRKILLLTKNSYIAGVASRTDILAAETQLKNAQATADNNKINRTQYEHAIAVLIGKPPENFALDAQISIVQPPKIAMQLPSSLLEHRPDIAEAERNVAAANAKIGEAKAAYFPSFFLNTSETMQNNGLSKWFSLPNLIWSVGPTLAETIFDGGLRRANTKIALANYEASVANYKQTVLSALQEVEDNLAALNILIHEAAELKQAAVAAQDNLTIIQNRYYAGTANRIDVLNAEISAYTAKKSLADINGLHMTTVISIIKALGTKWD